MGVQRIDPKSEFKYVSIYDEAIDKEKSNLEEYQKNFDKKHLVLKEDIYPDYFLLKNLSARDYSNLISKYMKIDIITQQVTQKDDSNILEMGYETFNMACKEIESTNEKGESTKERVNADQFPKHIVEEVSKVIMDRANLGAEEKK